MSLSFLPLYLSLGCSHKVQSTTPDFLYFVLVDRFANGDTANDVSVESTDPEAFHGGDLNGVEQHLDHIQQLGADSIWLSPIYNMRTEKFHGHGAFHGYWTEDLTTIAPLMGGEQALTSLTREMDKRNMSLILDVVYNHTSFDAPLRSEQPDWFHPDKTIENWNDPVQLTTHQVHGLPDLDQSNPEVYQYLLESSRKWLQMPGVLGLRVDAIRHMDNAFLKQINQDLDADGAWLLGEDFQGNPIANIDRFKQTNIDALFDFPLYYALTNSICDGQSFEEIASIVSLDSYYPENSHLVRFLDNHDLPRILSRCNDDKDSVLLSEFLLFGLRGTPMISYGTEHWSTGSTEPGNRQSMQWDSIDDGHVQYISTLSALRKDFPVLKNGLPNILHASQDQLVLMQHQGTERSILAINRSSTPLTMPDSGCETVTGGFTLHGNGSGSKLPSLSSVHSTPPLPTTLSEQTSTIITCTAESSQSWSHSKVHTLMINIEGTENKAPRLVGSLPELGGWNPQNGVQTIWNGEHWTATITLPSYKVSAFKLVYASDNGFEWEDGSNRFLHSSTDKTFWIR